MERGTEGGNMFSQKYPTEAHNKDIRENVSMRATVFQPPPREDFSYNNMRVKWNCSDSCNHSLSNCPSDIQANTLWQTQGDPVASKCLQDSCMPFLHDNGIGTKREILVPPCSSCMPGKELCVKSDATNACRNSHEDSLNSELLYGMLHEENNLGVCMNEQMKFSGNAKNQLAEPEKTFPVTHGSAIADMYEKTFKVQNKNSNNYFQLYATHETLTKQNYIKTQPTFNKGQVYVDHTVPDFSMSESPNCFVVSNVSQNDSFEQIRMLNTAVSYLCENEIKKNFIKTAATTEIGQDIHSILSPAAISVCNITSRQGNDIGDNPSISTCYKVNELKPDNSNYFPTDMAKLIYEIKSKLGIVPPSSILNQVTQICETAKQYCEKYDHSAPVAGNAFKNIMTVFLRVAYSWVASYESMKDISLFHPNLKNHIMKWKNSSEALLDVLIFAINNWNNSVDDHSSQLEIPDISQMVTFKPVTYPLSEETSSPNFENCQYVSERATECCVNEVYNNTTGNEDQTSKRSNSCKTDNNENRCSFNNSSVNTFHYENNDCEHSIKRPTNKTDSENVSCTRALHKKHKNYDTKIPRPFIYQFKNHKSSNEAKGLINYNNAKTVSEQNNVGMGMDISDTVNMLHTQNRPATPSRKFNKFNFTIKHPGILPTTYLEKTNTMSNFDCKVYKEKESTLEHHPENHENQNLKNVLSQQRICTGRMTSGGKKQMKRPFSKIEEKRTKNSQNCDSDDSGTYEYLRPGSYKVPMKCSTEIHNKSYNSQGVFHSSFKLDSSDGTNKKFLNELKTSFSKNGATGMPHEIDRKEQLNDVRHHKLISREKMGRAKSLMPTYPKHVNNGKRPTVYWNRNEHQLPRCHSYYNARQRERLAHKRTENRKRNAAASSLNNTNMNTFEEKLPIINNSQNFSIMKKCKLENNTFTVT